MRIIIIMMLLAMLAVPGATARAQGADEREVVVTGLGPDEEEAKKQAYRNAVQTVIGSLVVAETLVENDQLVEDKILSHSDGYITKVKPMGEPKIIQNGLVSVTMQVTVKSEQLREKLVAENIIVKEMDGESLFTRAATKKDSDKDASAIVKDALKDMPASVIKAEANVEEAVVSADGGLNQVTLPVSLYVDDDAYGKFVGGFMDTLEKLGYKRKTGNHSHRGQDGHYYLFTKVIISDLYGNKPLGNPNGDEQGFVVIAEALNLTRRTARISSFIVPKKIVDTLAAKNSTIAVGVELLNADGSVITRWELNIAETRKNRHIGNIAASTFAPLPDRSRYEMGVLFPVIQVDASRTLNPTISFKDQGRRQRHEVKFNLTDAELREAKSVRCTVTNAE